MYIEAGLSTPKQESIQLALAMQTYVALALVAALCGTGLCQLERLHSKDAFLASVSQDPHIFTQASRAVEELWSVYLPQILGNASNGSTISQECIASAESIVWQSSQPNVTMPELVPLLDATGKIGAGVLSGNWHLVPAFDECFEYNYTGFCMGSLKFTFLPPSSPIVLSIGLCVPKYCNSTDVTAVMNSIDIFEADMKCTDRKHPAYTPGAIVMIVVCALFVILIAAGTTIEQVQEWTAPKPQKVERVNNGTEDSTTSRVSSGSTDKTPLVKRSVTVARVPCCSRVKALDFITAFSLYKTIPTLFATKQAPGVITSMNGLRVISMFWVILGHTYDFSLTNFNNVLSFESIISRFSFQPIINGNLSVDTFFFLSGVLVTYLTLRQMKKMSRFPFLHYYAHRYLRLTPIYAFVLFFAWHLNPHFASGPASSIPTPNACSSYWWTNLLYINNFYPWRLQDECAGWTWYLANDMQFYVIAPLVVIPLYYLFPIGIAVAFCLLLSGFIVTATLSGVYDFQAFSTDPAKFQDLIYIKPWGRISPYLVGLVFGFVVYKQIRFQFGRIANIILYGVVWIASGVVLVSTLYGLYFGFHGHVLTKAENVIYITLSRFSWGVGLALVVFACHNGYGGHVNSFLSLKIWTPLSRMTLNAYLFHPIVIFTVYGQLQTVIHLTDITMGVYAVAFVVLSYAVAAVLCVCVELPLGNIEILLFKLIGIGSRESQRQATSVSKEKEKKEETVMVTHKEA